MLRAVFVELEPESQNALHGALGAANLALVYALIGEQDQAVTLVERLLTTPGPISWPDYTQNITLADLRLRWEWDPQRSNPHFQKSSPDRSRKLFYQPAANAGQGLAIENHGDAATSL